MLKRRAFVLLGSAAAFMGAKDAQAFFMGGVGVSGLANLQAPLVNSIVPNNGPPAGGTVVTLTGFSFCTVTSVSFGGIPASNVVITGNDILTCTAPPHLNGAVNVVLTNPAGPSVPVVFNYGAAPTVSSISPSNGPIAGGTPFTITGTNFTGATGVTFGAAPVTPFTSANISDDSHIIGNTPAAGGASVADVVVTNAVGSGTLASAFNYQGGTFSTSIPLGNFTGLYTASGGQTAPNADGTTTGWTTTGGWTILQTWVNFPSNDFYTLVIPAYVSQVGAIPGNSIMIYIDQIMIPTSTGNATNRNWFCQFVQNLAPVQNYSWSCPVTAGQHSIEVVFNTAAYHSAVGTGGQHPLHGDRLNITSQNLGFPVEPAGNRDPAFFPMSSYHFINMPFGVNAVWLPLSSPIAHTVNGLGGNGSNIGVVTISGSFNFMLGGLSDPVFSVSTPQTTEAPTPTLSLPYPVRNPAGTFPSLGGDQGFVQIDTTNSRFSYVGFLSSSQQIVAGRNASYGVMSVQDTYNLNHASPQGAFSGYGGIRVADLDSGVIAHRLIGGLADPTTAGTPIGYGLAQQTSDKSGLPWPGCQSDFDWPTRYTNANGPPYGSVIGIPPTVAKPAGLNTATSMAWDCMQNYGCYLNVSAGNANSPMITVYAEGAAYGHPTLTAINWSQIVPSLSVMDTTNLGPLDTRPGFAGVQGFGGGALRPGTALLPGVRQGLPSLGIAPYTFPSSPAGIPIQLAPPRPSSVQFHGSASFVSASVTSPIPTGSFVVVFYSFDRPNSAVTISNPVTDSAGNSYTTIIQPPTGALTFHGAMAVCLSTTSVINSGTTWTFNVSPTGQVNYYILGAFFLPRPASGAVALRTSSNANTGSNVTTLSTTLAGVQAGDLVLSLALVNNYAEITDPAGFGSLLNLPGMGPPAFQSGSMTLSFRTAPTTATQTINPTWNNASPASLVAAAFVIGSGGGTTPTVSTVNDTGTNTPNGSTAGNRPVTITGTNLTGATNVTFGGVAATIVSVAATTITCRSPPHAAGLVSVAVTTAGGTGSANAYTYRLVDGSGTALALPSNGGAASTWGFSTLSFQDEFNDLLSVQVNASDNNGSNYVTPLPGYNWYTQEFGWANTTYCGTFQDWKNGTTACNNPPAFQFYLSQYFTVASSVMTMVGHTTGLDTIAELSSTAFVNNGGSNFVGVTINSTNGWYIESRLATLTGTNTLNAFWCVDNRALTGAIPLGSSYTEFDFFESHPSQTLDMNVFQWGAGSTFGGANVFNSPTTVSGFTLDNNFHVYGALFVPASRNAGQAFIHYFIDGVLQNSVSLNLPNGAIGTTVASQPMQLKLQSNSNTNDNPFQIDYIRVWQQTPTG